MSLLELQNFGHLKIAKIKNESRPEILTRRSSRKSQSFAGFIERAKRGLLVESKHFFRFYISVEHHSLDFDAAFFTDSK